MTPWPTAITDHQASGILELAWQDGTSSRLPHALLRARCRCAACEQQFRTKGGYPPIDDNMRLQDIRPVADKALNLVFSDGHGRGIYPWDYLRDIGREQAAAPPFLAD